MDEKDVEWNEWLQSMIQPATNKSVAYNMNKVITQQYQTAVANQLNQPMPYITMPPAVANAIEPFKVHAVIEVDGEGMAYVRAIFTSEQEAKNYIGRKHDTLDTYSYFDIDEFTLDAEVPVEEE